MDSSPSRDFSALPSLMSPERSGVGRKPSLLPAFEPLSSSPFPRPRSSKRKHEEDDSPSRLKGELKYYPTPVPTSSTGVLPSSPTRPALDRTMSMLTERAPLSAVQTVELHPSGRPLLMGRSSNSSNYQLSASRLISRVHIQATYHAPSASHPQGEVVIECLGWNGAKVHCRGHVYSLAKGETFSSDRPSAEIMLDVQDARVVVAWPYTVRKDSFDSDTTWSAETSPRRNLTAALHGHIASSPPPLAPSSPVSPSPARQSGFTATGTFIATDTDELAAHAVVQIYEDADVDADDDIARAATAAVVETSRLVRSRSNSGNADLGASQSSALSSFNSDDFSDCDEENDPIIHSFGAFGENLLPRMASISASSPQPQRRRRPLHASSKSPQQQKSPEKPRLVNESPIKNHVINQLAYSRLHSIPLSTILGNLPNELKGCSSAPSPSKGNDAEDRKEKTPENIKLSSTELKRILDSIPCIGEINRQGKDAAGKQLENEFYYVPEMDTDQLRRDAVQGGLGRTGLRAVRKNHKQYYWKRPRF